MSTTSKCSVLAILLVGISAPAVAVNFSFTGNFVNDNDVQLFNFNLLADATVTLQTFGYGGGTNANGDAILPGGFESTLQIFDYPSGAVNGGSILPGEVPNCGPRNPDPGRLGFCRDAYAQVFLTAGSYQVALTQYDNLANSTNLSNGFTHDGDPSFNSGFMGTFGFQGDSHWALDIVAADSASPVVGAPEPGSALLAAPAFLLIGLGIRRRVH